MLFLKKLFSIFKKFEKDFINHKDLINKAQGPKLKWYISFPYGFFNIDAYFEPF